MYYILPRPKKKINRLQEQIKRLTKSKNANIKRHDKEIKEIQAKIDKIGRNKANYFQKGQI